ncbi:MAG: D-2-hydroxyacid dehydrogenase [Clostridia bacterium]|nr:D-2-hydroxyacid dehydrogenase [Clostridia bacterium]
MKIVVLDGYAANPGDLSWAPLEALGELTVYDRTPADQIADRIADAELVLTNKAVLSRELIAGAKKLRYIGVLATGYNVVDVAAAKELGVVVTNIPAYSTDSVAQLVFALLLEICHNVGHHSQAVHAGRWTANEDFCFWDTPLIELAGKTMGVVGYGRIGHKVAEIARCFGMNVIAWTRTPRDPECVSLDELLARSDVISLHCPLFPETKNLINRNTIAKMKDGVILINTSRGPVVNDADLREALESGKVYAAGADVSTVEPIPADSPLLGAKNMFLTPHIAWATFEARKRLMDIAVKNVEAFLNGAPINTVN